MTDYGPYDAEEGTAAGGSGTPVTTSNTTAFSSLAGTVVFSGTGKAHGSWGYRWNIPVAAAWRGYKTFTAATQLACRVNFTLNSLPSATRALVWIVNSSFTQNVVFGINSSNQPIIQNAAGTTLLTGTALTAGVNYGVEIQTSPGTTTSDGTIKCQVYALSSTSTLLLNYSSTTVNAGAGNTILRGQVGANNTETIDVTFDDILWRTGTLTAVGPVSVSSGSVTVSSVDVGTGWTPSSGTNLSVLSDSDATTYTTSNSNPSAQELDVTLGSLTPPTTGNPLVVFLTMRARSASTATLDAQLVEGSTTRSSLTSVSIPINTTSPIGSVVTLTFPWAGGVQNVTDWSALKLKLQVSAA